MPLMNTPILIQLGEHRCGAILWLNCSLYSKERQYRRHVNEVATTMRHILLIFKRKETYIVENIAKALGHKSNI